MNKKRALGRGLSALLESADTDITASYTSEATAVAGGVASINIDQIEVNPFQPRSVFNAEALAELAASITEYGIIQPITVRKVGNDKFQLISGERRFRASQVAGLKSVPAYVRIANDQTMLEMALVENIQRENLDAIEIAISFQRLMEECELTQEGLSERVSKKRSTVANYLRLLKLPAEIQLAIREQKITMGHARALVGLSSESEQLDLFEQIIAAELSVRDVERLSKERIQAVKAVKKTKGKSVALSFEQQKLKEDLSRYLRAKVEAKQADNGGGKIVISFTNEGDMDRILDLLNG